MTDQEDQQRLLSALTTEHFAQQGTASATISESSGRATLYMGSLSSSLVALGFTASAPNAFGPLAAAVIPAVFILGCFTVARLVDTSIQSSIALERVSRIRDSYTTLSPDAAQYFPGAGQTAGSSQEWGLQHRRYELLLTTASMIATVNAVLAGAGAALLIDRALGSSLALAIAIGFAVTVGCFVAGLLYQRHRFGIAFPDA